MSAPLSFWTENDILRYIKENDVKLADIYGEVKFTKDGYLYDYDLFGFSDLVTTGIDRSGCAFCLFGANRDNRFLKLKEIEPKKYDFVMDGGEFVDGLWMPTKEGLGLKFVIDWLNEHGNLDIRY